MTIKTTEYDLPDELLDLAGVTESKQASQPIYNDDLAEVVSQAMEQVPTLPGRGKNREMDADLFETVETDGDYGVTIKDKAITNEYMADMSISLRNIDTGMVGKPYQEGPEPLGSILEMALSNARADSANGTLNMSFTQVQLKIDDNPYNMVQQLTLLRGKGLELPDDTLSDDPPFYYPICYSSNIVPKFKYDFFGNESEISGFVPADGVDKDTLTKENTWYVVIKVEM